MITDRNEKTPSEKDFIKPQLTVATTEPEKTPDGQKDWVAYAKTRIKLASTSPDAIDSAALITGRNGMKFTQKGDQLYLTCYKYPEGVLAQAGRIGGLLSSKLTTTVEINCELTPLIAYRLWDFYGKRRIVNLIYTFGPEIGQKTNIDNFKEEEDTITLNGKGNDGKDYKVRVRCELGRLRVYDINPA